MKDQGKTATATVDKTEPGHVKDERHDAGAASAAESKSPASDVEEQPKPEAAKPEPGPTEPVLSDPTGLLTAEEILAGADVTRLESVEVEVGEWTPGWTRENDVEPRKVRMRVMTGDEAMVFAENQGVKGKAKNTMMRLICTCAVNEQNAPVFTEEQLGQIGALSFGVLQRLQNAALILNGFAEEEDAQEAAGNG